MADSLRGKVALVTSASSGIGEATAYALAAEGACVAVSARRSDRLEQVAQHIQERGGQVMTMVVDVADEKQANDMVKQAAERWGRLTLPMPKRNARARNG